MVSALPPSSKTRAEQWCSWDPNPVTASYVRDLLAKLERENDNDDHKAAADELAALFPPDAARRIGFGTAGLRSSMRPGPLHMNDLVVLQTAQGLARYCQSASSAAADYDDTQNNSHNSNKLRVVIGYDHRANPALQLSSLSFAIISALVLANANMECILLEGVVHTPLVAFATQYFQCAAAIMVTASHNPARDNGYKVYWKDGCQIRPPLDNHIADSILENLTPWLDYGQLLEQRRAEYANDPCLGLASAERTEQVKKAYYDAIVQSGLITGQARRSPSVTAVATTPSFVYTAMHGVGLEPARRVFQVFGLPPFRSVAAQERPDPTFPTVSFPNPEEQGALDIAKELAVQHNCHVVLANDPDADRLAVAEYDPQTKEWVVFTGDQIGTMLGHWLWKSVGKGSGNPVAMCASTVSSKMLSEIARVEGFHYEDTLTGFKWIGTRLSQLSSSSSYKALFGYEEAIGFCCGDVVHDKDGITAMAVFAELTYHVYRQEGSRLSQHMQSLYDQYGEFVSNNGYFFCHDTAIVEKIFQDMRNHGKYMKSVGEYEVASIRDLGTPGYDSSTPDERPTLPTSSSSPMMTIAFTNGCVAQFRASGTEPKFKYYLELKGKPGVSREQVKKELEVMSACLLSSLLRPNEHGLVRP